jgi:cytochrome P450
MIKEKTMKAPPVPIGKHWLMGNTLQLMNDMLGYLAKIQKENGNIVYLTAPVAAGETYVIYDAEYVKHVLLDNHRKYQKGNFIKVLSPLFGNGLVSSEGDFWKKQRRLIQPAFHKQSMAHMATSMMECIDSMVGSWEKKYSNGDAVDLTIEMNRLALVVVAKSLFKADIEKDIPMINGNLNYILPRYMKRLFNPLMYSPLLPTLGNWKEKQNVNEIAAVVMEMIKAKRDLSIPRQDDILDMLLDVKDEDTAEKMSDEQIRDELITIMIAGHETTAHAMSYMFYLLTQNPEEEKKVRKEIAAMEDQFTFQDLMKAPYIRQVVMETLRLYPPAFIIQRQALEDDEIGGYHVPKGMNVLFPIYVIHRMEEYWDNPNEFHPDRFHADALKNNNKYTYFPFGGGPRLCIGDQFAQFEMMMTLIKVFKKFEFKNETNYKVEPAPAMALKPKENVRLSIYRR